MSRRRVAVVVFHGGGPYYVEPLLRAGRMPEWARLAAAGTAGTILSPYPVAAGAWVTLLTGLDVAQHGVLDTCRVDARRFPAGSDVRSESTSYQHETVFTLASRAGLRVGGLHVPMTAPPWPVNGVLVPGVPLADEIHPPTFPPGLGEAIGPVSLGSLEALDARDVAACRRHLDFDVARMVEISARLQAEHSYDLFVTVLKAPDVANHLFHQNPVLGDGWRAVVEEYFVKADVAVGELARLAGPDTVVIVVSDHGCGPMPPLVFRPTVWLEEAGLLRRHAGALARVGPLQLVSGALAEVRRRGLNRPLKALLPAAWVQRVRAVARHDAFVDLARTRVYPVDHFYPLAGFEVNLRGRQSHGVVEPGRDYEAVRDELLQGLGRIVLPDGRPAGGSVAGRSCSRGRTRRCWPTSSPSWTSTSRRARVSRPR